jgi:hypothetical protein
MNKRPSPTSIAIEMVVVVVLAFASVLWVSAGADAGTYVIDDCPSAPTSPLDSGPWTIFSSPQADQGSCGAGAGDWIGPLGTSMSPGSLDGVSASVPAGSDITIHEARVWWLVPKSSSGADVFAIASASGAVVDQAATPYDRSTEPDDWILPSTTTSLVLAAYCSNDDAGSGCNYSSPVSPNLMLFGAQLTLSDENLPSGAVTGGALTGSGPFAGTQSLAFDASDPDTGIRTAQLLIDGAVVAQGDYLSECPYTNFAACPPTRSDTLDWNTSSVNNGQHELALRVIDAAGNTRILDSHTITTSGQPSPATTPIGPGSPAALRGAPNGTNASDQAKVTARWKSTAKAVRTSAYGQADRITGRLNTSTGEPISGALLDVTTTAAAQGARTASLASARTDSTGAWTLTLPRNLASSTLRFAYRSHINDTLPVATTTLTLRVHAGIALQIAPHITNVGRTIRFTGTLRGTPIPPGGKQLVLEASSGGEWIEFRTITTDTKGRYHASYRFKFAGPIAYRFRVYAPHEADFPFLSGTSNVVGVYER